MSIKEEISNLQSLVNDADLNDSNGRQIVANSCRKVYGLIEDHLHEKVKEEYLQIAYYALCNGDFSNPTSCESKRSSFNHYLSQLQKHLPSETSETDNTPPNIYLFHVGRGGRFNNPGHKTFLDLVEEFNAEDYGINIYYAFEKEYPDLMAKLDQANINFTDFVYSWTQEEIETFLQEQQVMDDDGDLISYDDLGDRIVTGDNGKELTSLKDYQSQNGSLNIDNDYDTYCWSTIDNLSPEELLLIIDDLPPEVYKNDFIKRGVDKDLFVILEKSSNIKTFIYELFDFTLQDFLKKGHIIQFTSEDEAEAYSEEDYVSHNDLFYYVN